MRFRPPGAKNSASDKKTRVLCVVGTLGGPPSALATSREQYPLKPVLSQAIEWLSHDTAELADVSERNHALDGRELLVSATPPIFA